MKPEGWRADADPEAGLPPSDRPVADISPQCTPDRESSNLSILIVEDNEQSRNLLRDLLQLEGHEVIVAEDGASGLRAMETQCPDVALIDIGLPGMSGCEVAEHARKILGNHQVQLVALTGHGRAEDRQAVREAGFDQHLVKPLNLEELSQVLKRPPSWRTD
jgi:two-component system CheB/CheR fusion protein